MSKVPQRDEIWKDKYTGKLIRIRGIREDSVFFFDIKKDEIMINAFNLEVFKNFFEFVGDGKPINVLFEVQE